MAAHDIGEREVPKLVVVEQSVFERFASLIDQARGAGPDPISLATHALRLHAHVINSSGLRTLELLWHILEQPLERHWSVAARLNGSRRLVALDAYLDVSEKLFACFKARDVAGATRVWREHLATAHESSLKAGATRASQNSDTSTPICVPVAARGGCNAAAPRPLEASRILGGLRATCGNERREPMLVENFRTLRSG
jgi:FCD domain